MIYLDFVAMSQLLHIAQTCLCNTAILTVVKIDDFQKKNCDSFLSLLKTYIGCGYALELPYRGGSNGYPQSTFYSKIRK